MTQARQQSAAERIRTAAASVQRRRRLFWLAAVAAGLPFLLLLVLVLRMYFSPSLDGLYHEAILRGEARLMPVALPARNAEDDPFGVPEDSLAIARVPLNVVTPALVEALRVWVDSINATNENAILRADVDAYGNAYILPSLWWYDLGPENQVRAIEALSKHWRTYLHSAFGPWGDLAHPSKAPVQYSPGIIILDAYGEVARDMDGQVRILRKSRLP